MQAVTPILRAVSNKSTAFLIENFMAAVIGFIHFETETSKATYKELNFYWEELMT